MDEWVNNPQWWISTVVAGVIGVGLSQIYGSGRNLGPLLMEGAKGKLRARFRHHRCKRLKKIKSIRFHSVAINREIALSYALLVLFVTTAIGTIAAIISLPTDVQRNYVLTVVIGLFMAIPTLMFEAAWLNVSSRVDDILKHRKLIKRRYRDLN